MMRAIKSKGMSPELAVRRLAYGMGYRYKLHDHSLPGRPDMVFPGRRKVVFIHGCFWHRHRDGRCRLAHQPRSNLDYWNSKLASNKIRDAAHRKALRAAGWKVLIIWECEVETANLGERLAAFLEGT
ncbi:XorII very short patch repair endonuclease [Candidatus Sulfopaludibacter sp. SbA3]|nr:XorII very short patch repair endonuclease [Candidatus Sulfopaludibacter sp. SbA3]